MFSLTRENLPYFLVFLPQYLIPVSFYFFYEVGSPVYIFFFFFHFEDIFHLCGWCFIEDTFYWILFLILGWYITNHHAFEVPLKVCICAILYILSLSIVISIFFISHPLYPCLTIPCKYCTCTSRDVLEFSFPLVQLFSTSFTVNVEGYFSFQFHHGIRPYLMNY